MSMFLCRQVLWKNLMLTGFQQNQGARGGIDIHQNANPRLMSSMSDKFSLVTDFLMLRWFIPASEFAVVGLSLVSNVWSSC